MTTSSSSEGITTASVGEVDALSSQPESLDLDYDMWQGQFEFVGPTVAESQQPAGEEDLNLGAQDYRHSKQPMLLDEETFLSFHDDSVGPQSDLFIENGGFINNNNLPIEKLNNLKNKLIYDEFASLKSNNNKMNDIMAAELCDNLKKQVKLELLQRQVTNLSDTQNNVDDRTTRTKTEYAVLQARYHMLEEQLRDNELRAEERLAEEQKRHRELLARVEREAHLQQENCHMKINTIESESHILREEVLRLRVQCDKQAADLHATEEKLEVTRDNLLSVQQDLAEAKANERRLCQDKQSAEDLMLELSREVERLRTEIGPAMPTTSPETIRLEELHIELEDLRQRNKGLEEQIEELQAMMLTRGVEEGRNLLNGTSNSLAQELEEMNQSQDSVDSTTLASLSQIAFQEKEDENTRLKHYIDTILLNIVENYPQLLEVKSLPAKVRK